jgi:hypothetical protein
MLSRRRAGEAGEDGRAAPCPKPCTIVAEIEVFLVGASGRSCLADAGFLRDLFRQDQVVPCPEKTRDAAEDRFRLTVS